MNWTGGCETAYGIVFGTNGKRGNEKGRTLSGLVSIIAMLSGGAGAD
jgi:hypothetical protein